MLICLAPSNTFSNRFSLEIYVSKSKVSNDLDENCMRNETFVTGGHLEFLRHFELFFLKILNLFYGLDYQKVSFVIISTNSAQDGFLLK
jgi:hypothetical protein